MPSFPIPEGRRSRRILLKRRASLVINLERNQGRVPCLVLDSSNDGFRVRGDFQLRRGQVVEIILDPEPLRSVRCRVAWVSTGDAGQRGRSRPGNRLSNHPALASPWGFDFVILARCKTKSKQETISGVLELVDFSYRAKNSKRRPSAQDSLSLIVSRGFINFWTGTRFALRSQQSGMST